MSGKLCDLLRTSRLTIEGYVAASAAGVCMRCCLRFAVVQDMDAYAYVPRLTLGVKMDHYSVSMW